jgi:hypothetical protein
VIRYAVRAVDQKHVHTLENIATCYTADTEEHLVELHPNLPELYRRRVEALEQALKIAEGAALAAEALRSLVDAILFYPEPGRGKYRLELRGDLAGFLYLTEDPTQKARTISGTGLVCSEGLLSLVAGARFERAAFRL